MQKLPLFSVEEVELLWALRMNAMQHKMNLEGFRYLLQRAQNHGIDWQKVWSAVPMTLPFQDMADKLPTLAEVSPEN